MTTIASRPHVIEIEPQVRTLGNWNLVVCMEMALASVVAVTNLAQHAIGRRLAKAGLAVQSDDVGFPGAVNALPPIAFEAANSQAAVVSIVSALGRRAASYVVFTLSLLSVQLAWSAACQFGT